MEGERISGQQFKEELKSGKPKFGIFLNSFSHALAGQFSFSGYDWLLVDLQHGPNDYVTLSAMLNAIALGKAKSMVRVAGHTDRAGIQQALDAGADGVLIPYVNKKEDVEEAVTCCRYPTKGTRSVYFPQACTNSAGLLGYVPENHKHVIVAVQIETASSVENIESVLAVPGVDIAFLGQNDLCMSMGLFDKYVFPQMYFSPELEQATNKMLAACKKNGVVPGVFLFGTDRVLEFLKKGFRFIALGNDLHHALTQTGQYIKNVEEITQKAGTPWKRKLTALL